MVLNGQDDRHGRGDERALCDGLHHVPERDLGGERVPVVDDGLPVIPVPTIELDAPASSQQDL